MLSSVTASPFPETVIRSEFAAENLGRQWIGIDISPTACRRFS